MKRPKKKPTFWLLFLMMLLLIHRCLTLSRRAQLSTASKLRHRSALYPVSVDPITWGHCDILKRASNLFDSLVLGIGANPIKTCAFSPQERQSLSSAALAALHLPPGSNVTVQCFDGLTAEYAYVFHPTFLFFIPCFFIIFLNVSFYQGFSVILRGLRTVADLEDELLLHAVQNQLKPALETVLLPCKPHLAQCSSTIVRSLVKEGGNAAPYAPVVVKEASERRLLNRTLVGVVGSIASGKSSLCARLVEALRQAQGDPVHSISLDRAGHYVLSGEATAPCFAHARALVAEAFGVPVEADGSVSRPKLAAIAFSHPSRLQQLSQIMRQPIASRLYELMGKQQGVFVLEGATLVEGGWGSLVNNNLVVVDAHPDVRLRRLMQRPGHSKEEALRRIGVQMDSQARRQAIESRIQQDGWGRSEWVLTDDGPPPDVAPIAARIARLHANPLPWLQPQF